MPIQSQDEPQRIPPLGEYEKQFRMKFGREMTADERRFYELTRELLAHPPEEDEEII